MKSVKTFDDFRDKVLLIFIVLSSLFCIYYSIIFMTTGAIAAAVVQSTGLGIFIGSFYLAWRNHLGIAKALSIGTSYILVFIQNFVFFGHESGFHYMYLPLLVVAFTLIKNETKAERAILTFFTALLAVTFLFLQNDSLLLMEDYIPQVMNRVFFYSSILGTFMGLYIVLHYFSKEVAISKNKLQHLASIDPLTGISNRRAFIAAADDAFAEAVEKKIPLTILMIDIDRFKGVNDVYGHMAGDIAIREVARLIRETTRESDLCARIGGEEFAVVLPKTSESSGLLVAEKIRSSIEQHYFDIGKASKVQLTVSIGVSTYSQKVGSLDSMLSRADIALYWSKENGRNRSSVYFESL